MKDTGYKRGELLDTSTEYKQEGETDGKKGHGTAKLLERV
jgi:hypothetical protein